MTQSSVNLAANLSFLSSKSFLDSPTPLSKVAAGSGALGGASKTPARSGVFPRSGVGLGTLGHTRRLSKMNGSLSYLHETIEEEHQVGSGTPDREHVKRKKYRALRNEAKDTILESKKQWVDTPYSKSVVRDFNPPRSAEGIEELLQHSKQNFKPLPYELRHRRRGSRSSVRMSPYGKALLNRMMSPEKSRVQDSPSLNRGKARLSSIHPMSALKDITANPNMASSPMVNLGTLQLDSPQVVALPPGSAMEEGGKKGKRPVKPKTPVVKETKIFPSLPKAGSTPRWLGGQNKRSSKSLGGAQEKEKENKENMLTPGQSLRITRARPLSRPKTPAGRKRSAKN
ncbi:hypothetical protein AMATHDRAFT_67972 [Amanita thiersii Skay4041]|uniref:Uncharacterized protein n=1 Tax=Amanita thiersii Skay4041 TaxID=703135 RepID=A0A2A9NB28_9AGAR|nr:hypothetical protein AMATHDRAFT_67972 [Amanita thiersii Skay4041]